MAEGTLETTPNGKSRSSELLADSPVASSPVAASPVVSEGTAKTIHSLNLLQSGVGSAVNIFGDDDDEEETTMPGADAADNGGEVGGGAGPKDGKDQTESGDGIAKKKRGRPANDDEESKLKKEQDKAQSFVLGFVSWASQ